MDYRKILQERLNQEIENLSISIETKNSLQNAIWGSLSFYTCLPIDILNSVPDSKKYLDQVIELSVSSSFYLVSLIMVDKLIDNQEKVNGAIVEYLFFVKEEAIKKLQNLFLNNTLFWKTFQSLKCLVFSASQCRCKDFEGDNEKLLTILLNKSALVKLYVVSMKLIVQEQIDWDNILESLKSFHIAFQLLDDYEDLKEDIRSGQLNYYLAQEKNVDSESEEVEVQLKKLMATEIVENGLMIARKNACLAYKAFGKMSMKHSQQVSSVLVKEIDFVLTDIHLLKIKAEAKAKLSNVLVKNNQLNIALLRSKAFIYNNQEIDGSWKDFLTLAGDGHNWITAFVISMFAEFEDNKKDLKKAMAWLGENGGKYNQNVFNDADSMNFYLIAKYMMGEAIEKEDVIQWKTFLHDSGGFSTYVGDSIKEVINMSVRESVKGWTTEQACVSAVACWAASVIGNQEIFKKGVKFLEMNVEEDGHLTSYWWSEDYYATSFAIMCGFKGKTLNFLLGAQQSSGYWTNLGKPSVFYTALALKALEHVYINEKGSVLRGIITKGVRWILSQQYEDGSWNSEYILRIPKPSVRHPCKNEVYKKTSFGFGIITDDYKRVFTTALVYNILRVYKEYVQ